MGKQRKQWLTLFSWAPKSLWMMTEAMKLKDACSLEEKQCNRHCISVLNLDSVLKSRDFAYKSLSSQSYGFSSGHVWM